MIKLILAVLLFTDTSFAGTRIYSTPVFGREAQDFLDTVQSNTTSTTFVVASSFTTTALSAGRYRIGLHYHWTASLTTSDARFALFVDGVQVSLTHNEELSDASTQANDYMIDYVDLTAGTHTIDLRFSSESTLMTVTVNEVSAEIWRVR